ncbi:MAG: integration host factor subunit alpha [Rhodospirillales bacterium]|jgi:integration host factor subunit alpha|nr:integration host factor subunit alpha [Rhodospirillales bacterium]MBT4007129.1 integration host factor subunit alpha [Rhodospirillales bacterium]MBT5076923.1 integration host factor subunit alpha [Rhodospirillales bacterium]MBT5113462.1 integration host factor subunit alpha [Rhodospirillales bacterium]MBT5673760.1 integration host factor subunit alpha [Rhodospirillales bacterium]
MTGNTITRAQLGEAVYQEVGLSRNESGDLVEAVLSEISDALVSGENVKISSFGSFSVRQKGERIGRNPKTGEEVPILPRRVLVFRASHVLKGRVKDLLSSTAGVQPSSDGQPGGLPDGDHSGGGQI